MDITSGQRPDKRTPSGPYFKDKWDNVPEVNKINLLDGPTEQLGAANITQELSAEGQP